MPTDMESAIKIEAAASDSHFRLLPCPICSGDNVAYVQYMIGIQEPWKVRCFDCGFTVDKQAVFKHEAQAAWNKAEKEETYDRNHQKQPVQPLQRMPRQENRLF